MNDKDKTTHAIVETLTAEVRALMVGNRQVTLSVYRQLDQVKWSEIQPFGRVRDSKDEPEPDGSIFVVGRHRETGLLVRSLFDRDSWAVRAPEAFWHWAIHKGIGPGYQIVGEAHGRKLLWRLPQDLSGRISYTCPLPLLKDDWVNSSSETWEEKNNRMIDHRKRKDAGEFCDMGALEESWRAIKDRRIAELIPHELEYQKAERLPLIVLAGLR